MGEEYSRVDVVAHLRAVALRLEEGEVLLLLVAGLAFDRLHLDEQPVKAAAGDRQEDVEHARAHALALELGGDCRVAVPAVGDRKHVLELGELLQAQARPLKEGDLVEVLDPG